MKKQSNILNIKLYSELTPELDTDLETKLFSELHTKLTSELFRELNNDLDGELRMELHNQNICLFHKILLSLRPKIIHMLQMNQYAVFVEHDGGKATFILIASSEDMAKEVVMKFEGCPECAIIEVRKSTRKISNKKNNIGIFAN
jgi:hypothetical protein